MFLVQWSDQIITLSFIVIPILFLFEGLLSDYSYRTCSVKNDVLKNFAKFTGKHLCQSLFLNKVAGRPKQPWEHDAEETIEIECILLWQKRRSIVVNLHYTKKKITKDNSICDKQVKFWGLEWKIFFIAIKIYCLKGRKKGNN